MAANTLKAGHDLTVWDRSADAVERLIAVGAKSASTPRTGALNQDFVISMVRDDQASRSIWLHPETGALAGMTKGSIAIESSTLSPDWLRELNESASQAGVTLLDAMVSGSTPQASAAELVFLVGGDERSVQKAESLLKSMGNSIQHAGPTGSGCLAKLCTNSLMASELATLAEMIELLNSHHANLDKVLNAVAATTLWSQHLTADQKSMLSADFQPKYPIDLLLKDLHYTLQAAGGPDRLPTIAFLRSRFQLAADKGLGHLNVTAIAKLTEA